MLTRPIRGLSRPVVYLGTMLALVVVAGIVASHYWPDLRWIAAPEAYDRPLPRPAPKTKTITKVVTKVVERKVVVHVPTPKQAEEIEDRYDLKLKVPDALTVLTEVDTGKLAHGGTALVTLTEEGDTVVTIAPKRAPFFELGGPLEVGAGIVYSSELGQGVTLHAGKDLGRVWKITVKVSADLDIHVGKSYGRAAVLGVVRF